MAVVQLKNVVSRIKDFEDKDNTNLKYYVGGEHFDSSSLTINKRGLIEGSTIGPAFSTKFRPGDVLLMSRNPHLRKTGMVDFEGICSDVSYIIRTNDESVVRQRFIPLLFQSDIFWDFAEKHKKGSTNFFLNWSDFEKFEFDLPDIKKQDELCDALWSINDTLDSYKEQLKLCDELVKAQFVEMFGKCKVIKLFEIADIIMGQSPDSKSYNDDGYGMPFFQGKADYGEKYTKVMHYTTDPMRVVEENSILMSVRAPVGPVNIANVKCCIGRGLCGINAKEGFTNNEFIYNALKIKEKDIADKASGSTFKAITKQDVYNIEIPISKNEEMDEFSDFVIHLDKSKFDILRLVLQVNNIKRSYLYEKK